MNFGRCLSHACAHSEDISGAGEQTKTSVYVVHTDSISVRTVGISVSSTYSRPQCTYCWAKIIEERVITVGRGLFHQWNAQSSMLVCCTTFTFTFCSNVQTTNSPCHCCLCEACSAAYCFLGSWVKHCFSASCG